MKQFIDMQSAIAEFDSLEENEVVQIGNQIYKKFGDNTRGEFGNYRYFSIGCTWEGNVNQYDEGDILDNAIISNGMVYMTAEIGDNPEELSWMVWDSDFGWL